MGRTCLGIDVFYLLSLSALDPNSFGKNRILLAFIRRVYISRKSKKLFADYKKNSR